MHNSVDAPSHEQPPQSLAPLCSLTVILAHMRALTQPLNQPKEYNQRVHRTNAVTQSGTWLNQAAFEILCCQK